ncbi:MAG: hypothetical protein GXO92_03945 [FCB group bacterium]|nr:hypothetical protein [FCB group bacterium]
MIIVHLQFWGCSYFKIMDYPTPILLEADDHITMRYVYDVVTVHASVQIIEGNPTAYRLGIYRRDDLASPIFEKIFFPGDSIKLVLPTDSFSRDTIGNLAVLTPLGGDFQRVEIPFTVSKSRVVRLPVIKVRKRPYVLTGRVFRKSDLLPIRDATVIVADSLKTVLQSKTDSLGFFRFELFTNIGERKDLRLIVSTDGYYSDWISTIDFGGRKKMDLEIYLGPSKELLSAGALYRVTRDLTPFRVGPENGSPIQFFLSKGDLFVVSKVAGDRLYGFVEISGDTPASTQRMDGWVLRQFLEILQ